MKPGVGRAGDNLFVSYGETDSWGFVLIPREAADAIIRGEESVCTPNGEFRVSVSEGVIPGTWILSTYAPGFGGATLRTEVHPRVYLAEGLKGEDS